MYTSAISALFLASLVVATPLQKRQNSSFSSSDLPVVASGINPATTINGINIDGFGGFSSLNGFSNFCGGFSCDSNNQVFINSGNSLSCSSVDINVVQQQLAILGELAKQIILTEICEVEVQTLAFQQFNSNFGGFQDSLLRDSSLQVGFDSSIADLFEQLFLDGILNTNDFGFLGSDIGQNSVFVNSNWNDNSSPESVAAALSLAQQAIAQGLISSNSNLNSLDLNNNLNLD